MNAIGHPPADQAVDAVARNVQRVRRARGLSQSELARRAGIAKATLSQLELGNGNPTIETLFSLAKQLGVPLGVLLHEGGPGKIEVSRARERSTIEGSAVDMSLVDTFSSGESLYESYLIRVRPGRQEAAPHASGVKERVLVLEGRLLVGPLPEPVELGPGDHAGFDADRPHVYEGLEPVTGSLLISYPLASPAA